MKTHHLYFLLSLFLVVVATAVAIITPPPQPSPIKLGGYAPISNLSDPHVIEVAKFAVKEHNKQDKAHTLRFKRVLKGWSQVVAGINYRLIIAAKPLHRHHHGGARRYVAVVYERPWEKFMNLTSFNALY